MDSENRKEQKRLAAQRYRERHPEVVRKRNKEQYEKGKEKRIKEQKKYYSDNKDKVLAKQKERYARKRDTLLQTFKEKRIANPEKAKQQDWKYYLKKTFKLTPEEVDAMWKAQDGQCANYGCQTKLEKGKSGACIDHDHKTGKIRAILCRTCNLALGHAKDDVVVLSGLIAYLREHNEP
jgi:hypothetical protein